MLPSVFLVTPRKNSGLIPWNIPLKLFMWWTQHQSPNLYISPPPASSLGRHTASPRASCGGTLCRPWNNIKPMNHFHSNCIQYISYIYESLTEHDTKHSWCNCRKILWQLAYDIFQQQVACWGKRASWLSQFFREAVELGCISTSAYHHLENPESWLVI